jgi:hypothetical protein
VRGAPRFFYQPQKATAMTSDQAALAKVLANHLGVRGTWGGWLHKGQKPICQGWQAFWLMAVRRGWIVKYSGETRISRKVSCNGYRINWRALQ